MPDRQPREHAERVRPTEPVHSVLDLLLKILGVVLLAAILIVSLVILSRIPVDLNDDLDALYTGPVNVCVQNMGAADCQSAPRQGNQ